MKTSTTWFGVAALVFLALALWGCVEAVIPEAPAVEIPAEPVAPIVPVPVAPLPERVAAPTFAPAAGVYAADVAVTIACATEGAAIHYTVDASTPTAASPTYTAPVAIAGNGTTLTLRAMAVAEGMADSEAVAGLYLVSYPALPPEDPPVDPPPPPPPSGLTGPVLAALYDGTTVRLWDGTNTVSFREGYAVRANGRKVVVGSVLYFLDAAGAVTGSMNLPVTSDGVHVWGDPVVYTFDALTAEETMALDWTPGARTRIYRDGEDLGDWHENAWTYVSSFETASGDVVAVDTVGRFQVITRPELSPTWVIWAVPGGPIFYMTSTSPETMAVYDAAYPGGRVVPWTGGGIFRWGGQPWIEHVDPETGTGVWYTGYGDTWSPGDGPVGTFRTYATALKVFRGGMSLKIIDYTVPVYVFPQGADTAVVIAAFAQGSMLYFIECNTGTLWSYSPQTDVVRFAGQLYAGSGQDDVGFAKAKTLEPTVIAGDLYYHDAGTVWRRAPESGVIAAFSPEQGVWKMEGP